MAYMALIIALACLLSLDTQPPDPGGLLLLHGEQMIGYVTSTSTGIITLTFSLTILSIQIVAQNYSPRLLDEGSCFWITNSFRNEKLLIEKYTQQIISNCLAGMN
jgi:hypothetical protein